MNIIQEMEHVVNGLCASNFKVQIANAKPGMPKSRSGEKPRSSDWAERMEKKSRVQARTLNMNNCRGCSLKRR